MNKLTVNNTEINENISQSERLVKLNQIAIHQISVLQEADSKKLLK